MRFLNKGASSLQIAPWWMSQPRNQNQSIGDSIVTTRSKVFCNVKWGSSAAIECRKEDILQEKYQLEKQDADFGLYCDFLTRQLIKLNWHCFDSSTINRLVALLEALFATARILWRVEISVYWLYVCIFTYVYVYTCRYTAVLQWIGAPIVNTQNQILAIFSAEAYVRIHTCIQICANTYIYIQIYMCKEVSAYRCVGTHTHQ